MAIGDTVLKQSFPDNGSVGAVVEQIRQELNALLRQREETVRKIGTVKKTVLGLVSLFGDDVLDGELLRLLGYKDSGRRPGLTKECRFVLMGSERPLAVREICESRPLLRLARPLGSFHRSSKIRAAAHRRGGRGGSFQRPAISRRGGNRHDLAAHSGLCAVSAVAERNAPLNGNSRKRVRSCRRCYSKRQVFEVEQ